MFSDFWNGALFGANAALAVINLALGNVVVGLLNAGCALLMFARRK